ncbi:MAG: hypothetical protein L6R37_002996 [Teloschistes peruensis]|nr:MAG: hypothetical protein L6R37_002996 [Teloschistes peruensis]
MSQATYTVTAPPKPALTPPPGVTPNFEQPYTLLPYVELTIAGGIAISTILVAARIFVKTRLIKKWLWEDSTCIFGWLCYIVFVGLEWRAGIRGAGTHQWNLTFDAFSDNLYLSNYSDMFYCLAIASVKLSILLLITRIFLAVRRNILFWLTQALIWVNTLFYGIAFFLAIFGCRPRRKIWNPDEPGKCFDSKSLYITSASFNTFSDVAMLAVVIHMVFKLQMSLKRKVGITAVFGFGVFACICSIVRIFYEIKLTKTKDFTYVHMETGLLGYAEVACGLICTCLPILPLVWHHLSRSTGGGDVALGPINRRHNHSPHCTCTCRSPQFTHTHTKQSSTRNWSEAGEAHDHEVVKGKNWMRLEDGTIAPVPKAFHGDRAASDEQALTAAIAGV